MKEINVLILLRFLAYVYSGPFYQLLPNYTFNFKNAKTSSVISSIALKGDVSRGKDSFILTSNEIKSYGSVQTSKALNVSQFEYQISFKHNAKQTKGSVLGIWFYSEKTDMKEGRTFFGFTNQFKGFGVLIYTLPEIKESLITLHYQLILNEHGSVIENISLRNLDKDVSCTESLSKKAIKVTIITKEAYTEVMFDNINSSVNHCCHAFVNLINKKLYNIAITSFNGEYNGTSFQDQIEITKVAMFNTLYKDSRAILGLPDLPTKEYDYQFNQPLKKVVENKENKTLTLNDLNKIINKCSVDALELKEQMKKELNMTFLSLAIPFLSENINFMIESINKTADLIISNEEHDLFSKKIFILSSEYTEIVNRWLSIRSNGTNQYDLYNKIQTSLIQIHDDIVIVQSMDFYQGDKLSLDLTPLKIVLSKSNDTLNYVIYSIIAILVLVIGILMIQIFKKTSTLIPKEKEN